MKCAALLLFLPAALCGQDFELLNIGVFSRGKASAALDQFRPVQNALLERFRTDRIRGDVKMMVYERESALVADFIGGKLHLVALTPIGFIEARRRYPPLVIIGAEVVRDQPVQTGRLVARSSTSVFQLKDIVGRTVGLGPQGDPFYDFAARALLRQGGIQESELSFLRFTDTRQMAEMLELGRCHLALLPAHQVDAEPEEYRVFAEATVPNRIWVARGDLYPYHIGWFEQELTRLGPIQLQSMGAESIRKVPQSIYEPFLGYLKTLGLIK